MAVLEGLGLPVLHEPKLEPANPGGDYEGPWTQGGIETHRYHAREAVKIMIGALIWHSQVAPTDRIAVLFRAPSAVSLSQRKAGIWSPDDAVSRLNYWRMYEQLFLWLRDRKNPLLFVDGDALAADPRAQVIRIRDFLGLDVDPAPAVARIIPRPYPTDPEPDDMATQTYHLLRAQT